jgi:uncharacterized membrane protein YphA (DoxX/SURF4 family)
MEDNSVPWLDARRDWCMPLVRIYLGVGLVVKGFEFLFQKDELVRIMNEHQVLFGGTLLAHYVVIGHLLGGALMAIGFATRVGALLQIPIMLGAVFLVHWSGGFFNVATDLRFSTLVLFLLLMFVWHGSGALSIDAWLARRKPAMLGTGA